MESKLYPIYYVTYYIDEKNKKMPPEVYLSIKDTKKKGFHIISQNDRGANSKYNKEWRAIPDNYKVPEEIPAYHAGFKHMKELMIPRIKNLLDKNPDIKGFFMAEGDLCINNDFNFKEFIKKPPNKPTWFGYKKKLSDYIVGNFLLYFPRSSFNKLEKYFNNQKRFIYSDRFFTKLTYNEKFITLAKKSIASEIEHESKVFGSIRKAKCHIKLTSKNNIK